MGADVISMIRTDHHELERLFEMMKSEASSRPLALPLAVAMLTAHSRAEEDHVYPVLAKEAGEKEEAEHGVSEHHKAEQLGRRLLGIDPEGVEFETALEEWVSAVQHHMEEEESEILPELGKTLGHDRLTELGRSFGRTAGPGAHRERQRQRAAWRVTAPRRPLRAAHQPVPDRGGRGQDQGGLVRRGPQGRHPGPLDHDQAATPARPFAEEVARLTFPNPMVVTAMG